MVVVDWVVAELVRCLLRVVGGVEKVGEVEEVGEEEDDEDDEEVNTARGPSCGDGGVSWVAVGNCGTGANQVSSVLKDWWCWLCFDATALVVFIPTVSSVSIDRVNRMLCQKSATCSVACAVTAAVVLCRRWCGCGSGGWWCGGVVRVDVVVDMWEDKKVDTDVAQDKKGDVQGLGTRCPRKCLRCCMLEWIQKKWVTRQFHQLRGNGGLAGCIQVKSSVFKFKIVKPPRP